ncbi:hypothetical protein FRB94_014562 [Tulasnella sp. JGI-2019a]|nr:hypothetical protein FRB93_010989 [Tulasnella sp. JGI-2019a]KAG9007179.1 hypothetical protein FRB94_014562 [Tulasnella sp. JGI-2019a]KAG9031762.1 hypothetical protein FRB95_002367 [Tulasnella sp. JGI-2019a]
MSSKALSAIWPVADNTVQELDRTSFSGGESEDLTLPLQSVQRVALTAGRYQDDSWRAAYLATCLTGAAVK